MYISTVREEKIHDAEFHLKMAKLIHEETKVLIDLLGKMTPEAKSIHDLELVRAGYDYVESLQNEFDAHMGKVKNANNTMDELGRNTVVYVIA